MNPVLLILLAFATIGTLSTVTPSERRSSSRVSAAVAGEKNQPRGGDLRRIWVGFSSQLLPVRMHRSYGRDRGASRADPGSVRIGRDAGVDPFGPRKDVPLKLESAPANELIGSRDGGFVAPKLPDRNANAGPSQIALPGVKLHVFASEELNPDLLRRLVRTNVTLWLDTRSNMLRDSTLENLRRADESFVRFHPPVSEVQQQRFGGSPQSGVWMDANELGGAGVYRIGGRPLAVELSGAPDAATWKKLESARPSFAWWSQAPCDAAAMKAFASLSGRKVIVTPSIDCQEPLPPRTRAAIRGADVKLPAGADPGQVIVWIRPDAKADDLRAVLVTRPLAEFAVTVGASEEDARKLSALLDALELKRR